jgi:hypothetical protein
MKRVKKKKNKKQMADTDRPVKSSSSTQLQEQQNHGGVNEFKEHDGEKEGTEYIKTASI